MKPLTRLEKKLINRYMRSLKSWTREFDRIGKGKPGEQRKWDALEKARHRALLTMES